MVEAAPPAVIGDVAATVDWLADTPAAEMLNGVVVAPATPVLVAASVYPVPARSSDRAEKVATPAAAGTVPPPVRVPPLGFVPMTSATPFVAIVTRLLN